MQALRPFKGYVNKLRILSALPEEMPAIVSGHSASVMFYKGGSISELGRCPTRMAEVLASGRPVVASYGVGDVAEIVSTYSVGVLVDGPDIQTMNASAVSLLNLLNDTQLPSRCRQAALDRFSLQSGVESFSSLYREALSF